MSNEIQMVCNYLSKSYLFEADMESMNSTVWNYVINKHIDFQISKPRKTA